MGVGDIFNSLMNAIKGLTLKAPKRHRKAKHTKASFRGPKMVATSMRERLLGTRKGRLTLAEARSQVRRSKAQDAFRRGEHYSLKAANVTKHLSRKAIKYSKKASKMSKRVIRFSKRAEEARLEAEVAAEELKMATERARAAGKTKTKAMARLSKVVEETEEKALEAEVAAEEAKMEAEKAAKDAE
jgi:hypothetical protein